MCQHNTLTKIYVIRRNNPSVADGLHPIYVDSCIADYVQAMNEKGIITTSCCCGHGESHPMILVASESKDLMDKYGYAHEPYDYYAENGDLVHWVGDADLPREYANITSRNMLHPSYQLLYKLADVMIDRYVSVHLAHSNHYPLNSPKVQNVLGHHIYTEDIYGVDKAVRYIYLSNKWTGEIDAGAVLIRTYSDGILPESFEVRELTTDECTDLHGYKYIIA